MPEERSPDFGDINKTVFCIPYKPKNETEHTPGISSSFPASHNNRDLDNGPELRFAAYKVAWKKCLARMQETIDQLQSSSVKSVVQDVRTSYLNVLQGLPYPELPVITVTNPSLGTSFLNDVAAQLEDEDVILDSSQGAKCSVAHIYPGDMPNLSAGMRSIISNFVDKAKMPDRVKRKPTTSLAGYDMKYLLAWYEAWVTTIDTHRPNLVVVLHGFEQFNPLVMQDIFDICSGHIAQLPLLFLLSMSSPSSSYLHSSYPRATLSLLRVRNFTTPPRRKILQEILLKTFFDAEFEPDIMIGPAIIEYLKDYFTRYHSSVDAIFAIIHIMHLRHFFSEPLTLLVRSTPSANVLSQRSASDFYISLLRRVKADEDTNAVNHISPHQSVIHAINEARRNFYSTTGNLRVGFLIMALVQSFLEKQGYRGLSWSSGVDKDGDLCDPMVALLRGGLGKDARQLNTLAKKLKRNELDGVLDSLYQFLNDLSTRHSQYQAIRADIVTWRQWLQEDPEISPDAFPKASRQFSQWLAKYLEETLMPLEDATLWDVWYTGLSPFPAEMLNPSIRASLSSGLLRPHEFAEDLASKHGDVPEIKPIWEVPDTSILFKRYLDSGKMINAYDLFESFKSVLDEQRRCFRKLAIPKSSPKKRGKANGNVRQQPEEMPEEEEEKWNAEVQARFIRALHELDYLGFIKHTGRKADHVLRTVFDINDAE